MNTIRGLFARNLLAALAGLSLLSVLYAYSRPSVVTLTMEMSASAPSVAQLFYDTGHGFNEAESGRVQLQSNSLARFQDISFTLPRNTIVGLRFDPLVNEGSAVIRHIRIMNEKGEVKAFALSQVTATQQIASRSEHAGELAIVTTPGATDPIMKIGLDKPLHLRWVMTERNKRRLGIINLCLVGLYFPMLMARRQITSLWDRLVRADGKLDRYLTRVTENTSRGYLPIDAFALRTYVAIGLVFSLAYVLDLNGSSAGIYGDTYGNGPKVKPWLGTPKAIRSDEWAYTTPDILNQYYRAARFHALESVMGNHYVALTGNIPVADLSTMFRPQFWGFFVLPLDYAFSVYWQAKALLLVAGVFTFLLWITRSSRWALTGALWYFFSPATQWSYSWPSALPEMIGSLCLGTVCFCYLTVGRSAKWLSAAAVGTIVGGVNFALCAYPPHMIPLAWVGAALVAAWCATSANNIINNQKRWFRLTVTLITVAVIGAVGWRIYGELGPAITLVSNTIYPGHRVVTGGTLPMSVFASHFLQWKETEAQFPATLANICEDSGFLWLAPLTLLCIPRLSLSPFQKGALISLWCCLGLLFYWCAFHPSAEFGRITQLERSIGSRTIAAMGLANAGIVVLTAARFQWKPKIDKNVWWTAACFVASALVFFALLRYANSHLEHYFSRGEILLSALFLGLLGMLLLTGRKRALAVLLVIPQALLFGLVNPIERGLPTFTQSAFHEFVNHHSEVLKGKWLVYADTPVRSGFVAAAGCEVYTGVRYVPDVDHFALFAARGLDLNAFNRLGFLDAHEIQPGEPTRFVEKSPGVVMWEVTPQDPLLRQVGIRYLAFDHQPAANLVAGLQAISAGAVDGLWVYGLR